MTIAEIVVSIRTHEAGANAALAKGAAGTAEFLVEKNALVNAVEQYNKEWKKLQFEEFMGAPAPVVAAIQKRTIKALGIRTEKNKDTGLIEKITVKKSKTGEDNIVYKDIDLIEFEDWAIEAGYKPVTLNARWRFEIEAFNWVMCIRAGLDVGGEATAALIRHNFKLSSDARAVTMNEPTSNREACKLLQSIVDKILFVDSGKKSKDGEPLNLIKVDERDLKYIKYLMCSRRAACKVGLPKDVTMRHLIVDALNNNLNARGYSFEYESEPQPAPTIPGFTPEETAEIVAEVSEK